MGPRRAVCRRTPFLERSSGGWFAAAPVDTPPPSLTPTTRTRGPLSSLELGDVDPSTKGQIPMAVDPSAVVLCGFMRPRAQIHTNPDFNPYQTADSQWEPAKRDSNAQSKAVAERPSPPHTYATGQSRKGIPPRAPRPATGRTRPRSQPPIFDCAECLRVAPTLSRPRLSA